MSDPVPERTEVIYVTADSSQWLRLDVPFGLISPPTFELPKTIDLLKPLVGPVTFYDAECFQLPVPPAARQVADVTVIRGEDQA